MAAPRPTVAITILSGFEVELGSAPVPLSLTETPATTSPHAGASLGRSEMRRG